MVLPAVSVSLVPRPLAGRGQGWGVIMERANEAETEKGSSSETAQTSGVRKERANEAETEKGSSSGTARTSEVRNELASEAMTPMPDRGSEPQ